MRRLLLPSLALVLAASTLPGSAGSPTLPTVGADVLSSLSGALRPAEQAAAPAAALNLAPPRRADQITLPGTGTGLSYPAAIAVRRPTAVAAVPAPVPSPVPAVKASAAPVPPSAPTPAAQPQAQAPTAVPLPPPPPIVAPRPTPTPVDYGPRDGVVRSRNGQLVLNGAPYRFTGINAYNAATWWGVNWGCGAPVNNIDGLFTGLRKDSMVRFWAFQAQAYNNKGSNTIDWSPIDRVVRAAERSQQRLIVTLSDQAGVCDDGKWHDSAWYKGGYKKRYNDDGRGLNTMSYLEYVRQIVARYKDSPAIGMWEPVNEPQAADCSGTRGTGCYQASALRCPSDAAAALRSFFDAVGGEIKRIDPQHLVSTGVIGGGHCGMVGGDYTAIHRSPGVDVATFHDYGNDTVALPGELAERIRQARHEFGKPIIVEEVGIGAGPGCRSYAERQELYRAKIRAAVDAGADGYLPWYYTEGDGNCGDHLGQDDPTWALLKTIPLG